MKHLKTIVGINLLVMLVYSVLIRIGVGSGNGKSEGILLGSAMVICVHVFICLIVTGFMYGKSNDLGKAWLLSSGIVLLVGFSTCLGNASL